MPRLVEVKYLVEGYMPHGHGQTQRHDLERGTRGGTAWARADVGIAGMGRPNSWVLNLNLAQESPPVVKQGTE